jgi:tRNA1Val (adenine37-N6)-methyltransferase
MANDYFEFKQFIIYQDRCAFKVGTDGVILGAFANISGARRILDIGAGTGLISLMLAQRSEALIFAIEPDDESFSQLQENINRSKWSDRVIASNTRLQDFSTNEKFDLIVSNPPYFSNSLKNPDKRKSDTRHNDNLSTSDLLKCSSALLAPEGRLQVIMPYPEGSLLIAEGPDYGLFCYEILKIKPLPTSDVRRLVLAFSKEKKKLSEKFLTIEHGRRHEFTQEYIDLTRDFYLKF